MWCSVCLEEGGSSAAHYNLDEILNIDDVRLGKIPPPPRFRIDCSRCGQFYYGTPDEANEMNRQLVRWIMLLRERDEKQKENKECRRVFIKYFTENH